MFLNISHNNISNCSGLEALKELTFLDISYNMLSTMDGLEYLIKLKTLKIQGNRIEKYKNVIFIFNKNSII